MRWLGLVLALSWAGSAVAVDEEMQCDVLHTTLLERVEAGTFPGYNRDQIGIWVQFNPGDSRGVGYFQDKADAAAREVQDYFNHFAKGKRIFDVRGFVIPDLGRSKDNPTSPYYAGGAINEHIVGNPQLFADVGFLPLYKHVWSQTTQPAGICGSAFLSGNAGGTYAACDVGTILHELGHNFGLAHASTEDGDEYKEYGDGVSSIMGGGQGREPLNIVALDYLGWDKGETTRFIDSTPSSGVNLAPVETSVISLRAGEYSAVYIHAGYEYYVSRMQVRGVPYPIAEKREEQVYVFRAEATHSIRLLPDLEPGETKTLPGGVQIEYLSFDGESSTIEVRRSGEEQVPAAPVLEDEIPAFGDVPTAEHSGLWGDSANDGQGLSVHVKNGRVAVFFYTYDQNKRGTQRTYYAVGNVGEELVLYTTEGGRFETPWDADEIVAGKARLWFDGDTGVFQWWANELSRGEVVVQRVAPPTRSTGIWGVVGRDKEGFTVQDYRPDLMSAIWHTYGDPLRDYLSWVYGSEQRWYLLVGPPQNLKVLEAKGGVFNHSVPITLTQIGWASFDEESQTLTYDGLLGSQVYLLWKIL